MNHQVITVLRLSYWYSLEGGEVCSETRGLDVCGGREAGPRCEVSAK